MKVLVTGGAGYIGSTLVYELIDQGHEVIIIDDLSKGSKQNIHPKSKFYQADLKDLKNIEKIIEKEKKIEYIFHLAAFISVPESVSMPVEYYENNLYSTLNILKIMKKYKINNILFSSTSSVYGNPEVIPVKETARLQPINPYASSKLCNEYLIQDICKAEGFKFVIFRFFNVAGAHHNKKIGMRNPKTTLIVPMLNKAMLSGGIKEVTINGADYPNTHDGTCVRDYIHVVDLAQANIYGMHYLSKREKSNIFNLGSKNGYSVKEIFEIAKAKVEPSLVIKTGPKRAGDPEKLLADITRFTSATGWKPKLSIEDMILSDYEFRKTI